MTAEKKKKLLGMLGLAMRAGAVICGTERACDTVRRLPSRGKERRPNDPIVIIASDAAPNTRKRVADNCAYYGIEFILADATTSELSDSLGKQSATAVIALTDKRFTPAIRKIISE